ncbi:MAG: HAD-IC family P-type ATPase, partial [Maritimibacter sp.]|nr:HAD-IC family P-type ATPase [Maritimibacter sp.]
ADTTLPDRSCMVFSGTAVTRGHLTAVITATGSASELGRIADMITTAESGPTPLQERLTKLSKQLAVIVIAACLIIFLAGVLREPFNSWNRRLIADMLLTAVSLAVAAIPEGLPAIVTVVLALGSQRMAAHHAIVRRLSAVETLGSVNVICSDKTGTLTQNQMSVVDVLPAVQSDTEQNRHGLLAAAALCNDARIAPDGTPAGSATESALLTAAQAGGISVSEFQANWPRLKEIPFSSDRKRMSTLHRSANGTHVLLVKGAAERILERVTACGSLQADTLQLQPGAQEYDADFWVSRIEELAATGKRVLAIAARSWNGSPNDLLSAENPESSLTLLGLMALQDPVRPEAREAIRRCQSAGIQTVMITGDHAQTARAIAGDAGLLTAEGSVMSGQQLSELSDEELTRKLPTVNVFARVAPEHKLRIVKAFQASGAVVAMTGDGVNDAPALAQANVGIAVGSGTDVAAETADIVLVNSNPKDIANLILFGSATYKKMMQNLWWAAGYNI